MHTARPEYLLRICEGLSRTIRCSGGRRINIIEANYGRLTGGQICPGKIKTTYCGAARSQAKVRTTCQGESQCNLQATNRIYGDPCKGTRKYLEVRIIQLKLSLLLVFLLILKFYVVCIYLFFCICKNVIFSFFIFLFLRTLKTPPKFSPFHLKIL